MKFKRHKKIKRYRKINCCEYAVIFLSSDNLIEYICNQNHIGITHSSLYTMNGYYQLLITTTITPVFIKNIIFKDKLHIDEIKNKGHIICKNNAVSKLKKAFKKL